MKVTLSVGVGLLTGMGLLMDADFGGVLEPFRAFRAVVIPLPNAIRHACLARSVDEVGAEVMSVDKVDAEEAISEEAAGTAPTGEDAG